MSLLISSGGVNGIAVIGALQGLGMAEWKWKWVGGASIGALIAMLIAAGYIIEEIQDIMYKAELGQFFAIDPFTIWKIVAGDTLGLDSGALLRTKLQEMLFKKGKKSFDDMPTLNVYAVNLRTRSLVKFNKDNPCDVVDAVMASMCLPPLFEPVLINGDLYVDGAVIDGFPMEDMTGEWTGIYLRRGNEFKGLLSYLFYVLDIRDKKKDDLIMKMKNVITIECSGGALQDIASVRERLFSDGRAAARKWLQTKCEPKTIASFEDESI